MKNFKKELNELLMNVTRIYDDVAIIHEKSDTEDIRVADFDEFNLAAYIERARLIEHPTPEDAAELAYATAYAIKLLAELESVYAEELQELREDVYTAKPQNRVKPSNRLLAMQYHGSFLNYKGDEI